MTSQNVSAVLPDMLDIEIYWFCCNNFDLNKYDSFIIEVGGKEKEVVKDLIYKTWRIRR